jgi:hypothetical protein
MTQETYLSQNVLRLEGEKIDNVSQRLLVGGSEQFVDIELKMPPSLGINFDNIRAGIINEVNWLSVECPFLSSNSIVLGGIIRITVDPMPAKAFEIPPQTISDCCGRITVFVLPDGSVSASPPKN